MKTIAIVQARMNSTRLPGKVLMKVNGISMLEYEIKRILRSKKIDKVVVATTVKKMDDRIVKLCKQIKVDFFRGSEDDVLDRYYRCSLRYPEYSTVVRITGDCPLIDPVLIDRVIDFYKKNKYDYVVNPDTIFPDGTAAEIFSRDVLRLAASEAKLKPDREHVTTFIVKNKKFKKGFFSSSPKNFSGFRLTLDNKEDFKVIKFLIKNSKPDDGYLIYISLLEKSVNKIKERKLK